MDCWSVRIADYFARLQKPQPSAARRRRSRADKKRDAARLDTLRLPFGYQNPAWEALKAQMRPGDELWEFCTAKSSWDEGLGWAGYQLVRDGVIVCTVVGRMN